MRLSIPALALVVLLIRPGAGAQTAEDLFDDRVLHEIRLVAHPSDWQRLRANFQENTYYACDLHWRGLVVENVGIRSKGFGTRNGVKPGLRVDFNRFEEGQQFLGLKSIFLDNLAQDASMLKERLSMLLFGRMGLPASREAHARVYVNGAYAGVYAVGESVDTRFLARHFGENNGYLYKYEWTGSYKFEYRGPDPARYSPLPFEPHTHEKDPDSRPLVAMIRAVNEVSDAGFLRTMEEYLDLKLFVTHLAVENFLTESDGILGDLYGMANFYLYRFERKNVFQFIAWDKDATFTWSERPILKNVNDNVLTRRALAVPELRRAYLEALTKCAALAGRADGWLEQEIVRQYNQVRAAAREDSLKLCPDPGGILKSCSNEEFENEVTRLRRFARERSDFVLREAAAAGFEPPAGAPALQEGGAVSAAGRAALVPGSLGSLYGQRLGAGAAQATALPLPTALGGVSILVNGFAAPLLFVSPEQVNFQVPWEIVPGRAPVTALAGGAPGNTIAAEVEAASPAIFAVARWSDDVVLIFATGLGPVTGEILSGRPSPDSPPARTRETPTVTAGGLPAEVLFSGLTPGFVGLYQINVRLPVGAAGGLVLTIGGRSTAAAPIPVW